MKDLSIITVTYNDPLGLKKTLKSLIPLLKESISFEVIVVDGSSDKSKKNIDDFSDQLPIQSFYQKPAGVYSAMNYGLQKVSSKFVWFLNGGDELFNGKNLVSAIKTLNKKSGVDFLIAGVELIKKNQSYGAIYPHAWMALNLVGRNRICQQGVIYKASVFKSIGQLDGRFKIAADYDLHLKLWLKNSKFLISKKVIAKYDISGASSDWQKALIEFKKAWFLQEKHLSRAVFLIGVGIFELEKARIKGVKKLQNLPFAKHIQRLLRTKPR